MSVPLPRLFTVDDYYAMAAAGILRPDERVELIEGEIIARAAIGTRHASAVMRLNRLFSRAVGDSALIQVQNPVRLSQLSEPEPDIMVLRPQADFYAAAHPTPADTLLLVEVADSSIGFDRGRKMPLYARTGIAEYWLVDLNADRIDVYREPGPDDYRDVRTHRRGGVLHPLAFPHVDIAVDDVLPAPPGSSSAPAP